MIDVISCVHWTSCKSRSLHATLFELSPVRSTLFCDAVFTESTVLTSEVVYFLKLYSQSLPWTQSSCFLVQVALSSLHWKKDHIHCTEKERENTVNNNPILLLLKTHLLRAIPQLTHLTILLYRAETGGIKEKI